MENNNSVEQKDILRGQIYMIDLSPGTRSEMQGVRPCLIVQNNFGNKYSRTITIVPLTSVISKKQLPTHIKVSKEEGFGLDKDSIILCEAIRTIDKERIREYVGEIDTNTMLKVENGIMVNLGMFA